VSDVPALLAARMQSALDEAAAGDDGDDAARFAAAALACVRDALQHGNERSGALPLLAADALVTAACAHADATTLQRLAAEFAPARLAALLP